MAEKTIMLACAGGFSTSILVNRMQEAAQAAGHDYHIFATSVADIESKLNSEKPDVLLLGPQVAYMVGEIKSKVEATGTPFEVINMSDYGMMKGGNVLETAEKLMS